MMKLVLLALALTVAAESASLADTVVSENIPESEPEQMDQITDPSAAENEEHCIQCIGAG